MRTATPETQEFWRESKLFTKRRAKKSEKKFVKFSCRFVDNLFPGQSHRLTFGIYFQKSGRLFGNARRHKVAGLVARIGRDVFGLDWRKARVWSLIERFDSVRLFGVRNEFLLVFFELYVLRQTRAEHCESGNQKPKPPATRLRHSGYA